MSEDKQVIFRSNNILVVLQDFPTNVCFVTFNELETTVNQERFWGDAFFKKLQIASIGVVTTEPNWYPIAQMRDAIVKIGVALKGRRVITYGHSQGGYGALKFSRPLGAVAAISFCPQISIDPAEVGHFDQRFVGHFKADLENGRAVQTTELCPANYVFFDPFEPHDMVHAKRIKAACSDSVHLVPAYFSGHSTVRLLTEGRVGAQLIESFCGEALPSVASLRSLLRKARRFSNTYKTARLLHLLSVCKRHGRALELELPIVAAASRPLISVIIMVSNGLSSQATEAVRSLSDQDLDQIDCHFVWTLFRKLSFAAGEHRLAEAIPRIHRNSAYMRLHAVNSFINLKRGDLAERELKDTLRLRDCVVHIDFIIEFARSLRLPDVLDQVLSDERFAGALSISDKRVTVTLDLIALNWLRNKAEAALSRIGDLPETIVLDRRYVQKVTGGTENNSSSEYAFSLFDKYFNYEKSEHSVSRMELLALLAWKCPPMALNRLERNLDRLVLAAE